jgi:tetratricopeptide (TPR) repeat protein
VAGGASRARDRAGEGQPRAHLEWALYALLAGLVPTLLFTAQLDRDEALGVAAASLLLAGACFSAGFLLGFLFGIPRPVQQVPAAGAASASELPRYLSNTNLGQVSDWLTKILVGVGLTQIASIGRHVDNLLDYLRPALGDLETSAPFGLALLSFYTVGGFMVGYLWTSIHLPSVLRTRDVEDERREREALREKIAQYPAEPRGSMADTEGALDVPRLDDPEARKQVAEVAASVKTLEEAGEGLDDPDDYLRLARQLKRAGRFHEAEHAYLRAYELDPTNPAPLNFAGVLWSKYLNDPNRAARLFWQALGVNPEYTSALYNAACNEVRRGNADYGLDLLAAAVARESRYRGLAERDAQDNGPFAPVRDHPRFREIVT